MDFSFISEHPFITAFALLVVWRMFYPQEKESGVRRKGPVDASKSHAYVYDKKYGVRYKHAGSLWHKDPLEGVDTESFVVLAMELGKDKKSIYHCENEITHLVDYDSFRLVSDCVFADKHKVFVHERWLYTDFAEPSTDTPALNKRVAKEGASGFIEIDGADALTFEMLDETLFGFHWAKDKDNFFYDYQIVDIEYESLSALNEHFIKDAKGVYFIAQGEIIKSNIAPEHCQSFNDVYVYDQENLYYLDYDLTQKKYLIYQIPYQNINKVKAISSDYLAVDKQLYFQNSLVEGMNCQRVMFLKDNSYCKDNKNVYYCGKLIKGVDLASFALIESTQYCLDANHVYIYGKKIEGAIPSSFETMGDFSVYAKDEKNVYWEGHKIEEADAKTFQFKKYKFRDKHREYEMHELKQRFMPDE